MDRAHTAAICHQELLQGSSSASLTSGGVANLGTYKSFNLAANAETQGLNQYANHRNIRHIYIVCEVAYRIVADERKGITKLSDLKGKNIGTMTGTSTGVFVHNMMRSVGGKDIEYRIATGSVCMKTPCGTNTYPEQIKRGVQALGANAVTFQNASLYREVYSLYSTTEALNDTKRRKDAVEFVRALNKVLDVFANQPKQAGVYDFVAKAMSMDGKVVEVVWADHKWSGLWDDSLIEFLVEENAYLAKTDNRQVIPRNDIEEFLDTSVINEL